MGRLQDCWLLISPGENIARCYARRRDLRIAPLRKNTPESAEALAEKAYALMPHVKITELLAEVDQWTSLGDRFLHLRTQAPAKNRQALLTAILADGINLGLLRMSEACRETTWRQLSWRPGKTGGYARIRIGCLLHCWISMR